MSHNVDHVLPEGTFLICNVDQIILNAVAKCPPPRKIGLLSVNLQIYTRTSEVFFFAFLGLYNSGENLFCFSGFLRPLLQSRKKSIFDLNPRSALTCGQGKGPTNKQPKPSVILIRLCQMKVEFSVIVNEKMQKASQNKNRNAWKVAINFEKKCNQFTPTIQDFLMLKMQTHSIISWSKYQLYSKYSLVYRPNFIF